MPVVFSYGQRLYLARKYNLSVDDFLDICDKQNYRCAICNKEFDMNIKVRRPAVDHDHRTGEVRGILRGNCNTGLGMFKDNTDVLARAIMYLDDHRRSSWASR